MNIDILNYELTIDGKKLVFPMSYKEVKAVLGDARIVGEKRKTYIYDDEGLLFQDTSKEFLRKNKAYTDPDHLICSMGLYVTDKHDFRWFDMVPTGFFAGSVTFNSKIVDNNYFNNYMGCYQDYIRNENGEFEMAHVGAYIGGNDEEPNFDGERLLKNVCISFKPRRPKSTENYNIEQPDEECLLFDNFNFKLAVVEELMYRQEVLKPYFDIYDYKAFKKAAWNLETDRNIRSAIKFFKELPIAVSLAEKVEFITMDGGDEIYGNIAPLWDGEDDRFNIDKLSESELKQFPNLKSMSVITNKLEDLKKVCGSLSIEVREI